MVLTTEDEWILPSQAHLLQSEEESEAVPMLQSWGIKIVSEDLRPYQNLPRSAADVPFFGIETLCGALLEHGLNQRTPLRELPAGLVEAPSASCCGER